MTNARTANLITNNVKKTDHGPVVNLVTSTPVLPDGYMQPQTVAPMTNLMEPAVLTTLQKVVHITML